jgi:putative ABC transport system substrate-binding protein
MSVGTRLETKRWLIWVTLLLSVTFSPLTASAQKPVKVWHVALCHVGLDHEPPGLQTLHQALNQMGYVDGKNLSFDWRNQPDAAAAQATIKMWVAQNVDVIVGFEDQCVRAARAATTKIPIVFVQIYDPQTAGYIKSLAHPGGNLTGPVANLKLIDKRLELLKEIDPRVQKVLALFDGQDPYAPGELALARQAAARLGLKLVERDAGSEAALKRVFADLKPGDVDAVIVASPDLQTNHPHLIIKLGEAARLPVVGHREAWVQWGALLSYSTDGDSAGPVAARYIDKIFKGANPADLPVEELSTTIFAVNLKGARELGLAIPPSLQARVDRFIQ